MGNHSCGVDFTVPIMICMMVLRVDKKCGSYVSRRAWEMNAALNSKTLMTLDNQFILSEVLKEHHSNAETAECKPPKKKINLLLVVSDSDDENEHASVRSALDGYRAEPIVGMDSCPLE
ncbi:hypothetical protein UY3_13059 [Chelonia mydas]|uniref:Uncharacterized protein n=1 Tax=Chelonia mydas TaxID=8469 RepID=M7B2Z3_CHEMY|nr:hypothetical protein UY3_13059 [Chelonia mydas]